MASDAVRALSSAALTSIRPVSRALTFVPLITTTGVQAEYPPDAAKTSGDMIETASGQTAGDGIVIAS